MSIDIKAGVIAATLLTLIFFLISAVTGIQTVYQRAQGEILSAPPGSDNAGLEADRPGDLLGDPGYRGLFFRGADRLPLSSPLANPTYDPDPLNYSNTFHHTNHHRHPDHHPHPGGILYTHFLPRPPYPDCCRSPFRGTDLLPHPKPPSAPWSLPISGWMMTTHPSGLGSNSPIQSATSIAVFSYARMEDDIQWSALWYQGDELVHYRESALERRKRRDRLH